MKVFKLPAPCGAIAAFSIPPTKRLSAPEVRK